MNSRHCILVGMSLLLVPGCGANDAPASPTFTMLRVGTTSLPNAVPKTMYRATLTATGGDGSYTWSVGAGSPPQGLSLSASGELTGIPTSEGTTFTVRVASGDGQAATQALSITVVVLAEAIVLRSRGSDVPTFWTELSTNWDRYGSSAVSVDYTTLAGAGITYNDLVSSDADVVIVDGAAIGEPLTTTEIEAIVQYVEDGHGLVVAGVTIRFFDYSDLIPLLGFSRDIAGGIFFAEFDPNSVVIVDPDHETLANIGSFVTTANTFYSGSDWDGDGQRSHPGDWELQLTGENAGIVAFIWNLNHLSGKQESSPISYNVATEYVSVFAGYEPVSIAATADDYQFFYNAILFTANLN